MMNRDNLIIIERFEDINYVLLKIKDATYQPYVAAWMFDDTDCTWGQGHYFNREKGAREHILGVYERIFEDIDMLEDEYEILDYEDEKVLVKSLDHDFAGWFTYEVNLHPYIPEDRCCRVQINGKWYYFG